MISEPLKLIRHIPVIAVKNPIKNSFPGFSLPFIKKYVERATKKGAMETITPTFVTRV